MTEKKLTPQQDKFARLVAEGKTQADAYRGAYKVKPDIKPDTVQNLAYKLMQKGEVRARVAELRNKADIKTVETIEKLTNELNSVLEQALSLEQTSSAVSAIMGKAKLLGLIVDKTDNKNTTTVKVEMPTIKKDGKEIEFKIG